MPERGKPIVWSSQFSKDAARSTDDARQRLTLRQEHELEEMVPAYSRGYSPLTSDEAADWKRQIGDRTQQINTWLADKDVRDERGRRLSPEEYHRKRAALIAEKEELRKAGLRVKKFNRQWSAGSSEEALKRAEECGDVNLGLLSRAYQLLKNLRATSRAEYTEEEKGVICAVQKRLRDEHIEGKF